MTAPYPPISDYALLTDCHSAALVSRAGSVDWCCFHRFDARPVFCRVLDWGKGGHFLIAPVADATVVRRYLPGTNVLETSFETSTGRVTLTDCMPVLAEDEGERPRTYHQLIRTIVCDAGQVEIGMEFSPRFDYGLTVPRVDKLEDDLAIVVGGADALVLQSALSFDQTGEGEASGRTTMRAGEERIVVLTYDLAHEVRAERLEPEDAARRVSETVSFWRSWSDRCTYDGPYRDAVVRSALVAKGMTSLPTGAIAAAPTTSLPEEIGGVRNWDYRYTWLRDAALNLYALFSLGYTQEAHEFMGWLCRTTAGRAQDLQTIYGVGGESRIPEVELKDLEGYRGSKPVRIGNAAADQFQLDIYGELVDTVWLFHRNGGEIDPALWRFVSELVDVVDECWERPDQGIWELRCDPGHFVSSKVMAWVALDRAIRLSEARGLAADLDAWRGLRDRIRARVESEGMGPDGGFIRAFGEDAPDASNLLIPLVRFLPANDPRVRATYERISRELTTDCFVRRYDADDGLPGREGAFLICSFWLVDNLAMAGEYDRACELFEHLLGCANDVGLLSEEVDPSTGELLGNFPQTFSHVGLIGAALNLERFKPR